MTRDADGGGAAYCHRCHYVESWRPERAPLYRPGKPVLRAVETLKHSALADWGRALWNSTRELSGAAAAYLESRACVVPPKGTHLRCLPSHKHPSGYVGPVLVALITHVHTRVPQSLHFTWVNADGTKADVEPARLLLKGHPKTAGVVRLHPDEHVGGELGIAEGIETALSLAHAFQPVWACIDAGNLKTFPVLDGIEYLVIAADNDAAGVEAARACAERWAAADKHVRIVMPEVAGEDINDLARAA